MKKYFIIFILFSFVAVNGQQDSTKSIAVTSSPQKSFSSKIYYGGGVGFNFWGDYFRISFEPMAAYKITPKFSAGVKLMYEYINDSRSQYSSTYNNFGGSFFTRFRIIPLFYLHAEFAYYSYKYSTDFPNRTYESEREWVPFLLLGGGFSKQIGRNSWAYVQALWDVIQDKNSPYNASDPWISVGVGIGF